MQFELAINGLISLDKSEYLDFSDLMWYHQRLVKYNRDITPNNDSNKVIIRPG